MDIAHVADFAVATPVMPPPAPSEGPAGRWLGPIELQPGVTRKEILFYLVATLSGAFSLVYAGLMQPLILNDQLHVPIAQQGMLTGTLATAQQLAVLIFIGFAGVMADRLGRRTMMIVALGGYTLGLLVFPLVTSVLGLFMLRFLWGAVSSAHTGGGATKMIDYPAESSRGKFIALVTITYAGVIAVFNGYFASHLASWYRSSGMTDGDATRWSFWTIALLAAGGLVTTALFMQPDRPRHAEAKQHKAIGEVWRSWKALIAHARANRRFGAVMLIATVIRTDQAVTASFLGLWVVQAGRHAGIDPIEATKTIGLLLSVQNLASLCSAPLFGWLSDRMDRLTLLIGSLGIMGLAFCSLSLVSDVFSAMMIVVMLCIGLSESAQALTANALLGEAAPPELRGAATGLFTSVGVASVLVVTIIAGAMFDRMGPQSAFILEGALCIAVFGAVLALLRRRPTA